ncbi:MAG: MFS transporter [Bryobacterales bacterium]|nr:MFS transporter [Bryobacterales bacterium]
MTLVALLWVALALNYIDRQMVFSIFPALRRELNFTDVQLGLVGSVFTWVYALGMPVAGRLADMFRRDRMIVLSLVLWSLATLGCGLATSVPAFLAWRAAMGITEALYFPAAVGAIAAAHGVATRSQALGIHQSAQLFGIIAGGWYGGWMADRWGWRLGFMIACCVGVAYALVLARKLPANRAEADAVQGNPWRTAAGLFRARCYSMLAVAFFAFCSMLWVFYAWFPNHLVERFGLSMAESGFRATMFVQLSCAAGVLIGGRLADKLSHRMPASRFFIAAAGIGLSAPFGYLTFASHSLTVTTIFSVAYGLTSGLMIANTFAAAYDVVGPKGFGLGSGVLNMIGGIAGAILIFLAGVLKSTIGFSGLLVYVGVGCVAAASALAITARSRYALERRG